MWRSKTCRWTGALFRFQWDTFTVMGWAVVSRDIINTTDSNEANVSWQPEFHSRREDFRWKVGDVGRDRPASQELSHLVGESVAVVLKQTIPVTSDQQQQQKDSLNMQSSNNKPDYLLIIHYLCKELGGFLYAGKKLTCMCFLPGKRGNPWRSPQRLQSHRAPPLCQEAPA